MKFTQMKNRKISIYAVTFILVTFSIINYNHSKDTYQLKEWHEGDNFETFMRELAHKVCKKYMECEQGYFMTMPKSISSSFNTTSCFLKLTKDLNLKLKVYTPTMRSNTYKCYKQVLGSNCMNYYDQSFQYPFCVELNDEIRKQAPKK